MAEMMEPQTRKIRLGAQGPPSGVPLLNRL
jgi:hypothetical protein